MWQLQQLKNAQRFSEVKEQKQECRSSFSVLNKTPVHILVLFTAEEPLF